MEYLNSSVFGAFASGLSALNAQERTLLSPNQKGGRVRVATFNYESTAVTAVGTKVALAVLPNDAKLLQVFLDNEALSSAAGTALLDLGLYKPDGTVIDAVAIVDDLDVDAAGQRSYYPVDATVGKDLLETTSEAVLTATVGGEDWAANKYVKGFVFYVSGS